MNFRDALIPTPQQLQQLFKTTSASASTQQPRIPPQPTPRDVPRSWAMNYLPPGMPLSPLIPMGINYPSYRAEPSREPRTQSRILSVTPGTDGEGRRVYEIKTEDGTYDFQFTPRSYQYPPNVNTTITPRVSYGLMSFADIQNLSTTTPDVLMCPRLLKREFIGLVPKVAHDDGEACDDEELNHLVKYPDGFNPLSTWLARWFYNGVIYDAPALHMVRDESGFITALVNIDGSTMFVLIDENGNPPKPPAPAFLQIIWGTPYGFASTEQVWYHPNDLQINSNYGTALVESANLPAQLLNNIWKYQTAWFTAGTLPEYVVTAPSGWSNDMVAAWLIDKTNALAGHPELRSQFDVWPYGFQSLVVKSVEFRKEIYEIAKREVMQHAGLPVSEIGETQKAGLGGRGFMDAMGQAIFRQAFLPWMKATAAPFNDVFAINHKTCVNGETFHELLWDFLPQSIDPEKEQRKITEQWTNGQITLGMAMESIGYDPPDDPRLAHARLLPKGSALIDEHGNVIASVKDEEAVPEELQPQPRPYPSAAPKEHEGPSFAIEENPTEAGGNGDEQAKLSKQAHWITLAHGQHVLIDDEITIKPLVGRKMSTTENMIRKNGYETGMVYTPEGKQLLIKIGDVDNVEFNKSDLEQVRGNIVVHNHPDGSTISATDIVLGQELGAKEIRVPVRNGTYSWQVRGSWPDAELLDSTIKTRYQEGADWVRAKVYGEERMSARRATLRMWHRLWPAVASDLRTKGYDVTYSFTRRAK